MVFCICQTILPMIEHVITGRGEDTLGNTSLLLMGFGNILAALVIWLCFVRLLQIIVSVISAAIAEEVLFIKADAAVICSNDK